MRERALVAVAVTALGAIGALACGASADGASPYGADAAVSDRDASGPREGATQTPPRVVVVNGLTEAKGAFESGVVLCIGGGERKPATPMPLTNIPGIPAGGGADLGELASLGSSITIDVFDAKKVKNVLGDCGLLRGTFPGEFASLSIPLGAGPTHVIALVTDPVKTLHVGARTFEIDDDRAYVPQAVHANLVNASLDQGFVSLDVSGKTVASADAGVATPFEVALDPNTVLVLSHPQGEITQSLQSVQVASDPTATPDAYFGVRRSFVFALVGDPALAFDANAPAQEQTGRELHLVAIPFGDGVQ